MQKGSIKNIIFDFGNIFVNLDFERTYNAFAEQVGKEAFDRTRKELFQNGTFQKYERGHISESEFFNALKDVAKSEASIQSIHDAWCSLLLGIPKHRFTMLDNLKGKFNLYMLSNINTSHANWLHAYMEKEHHITEEEWRGKFDTIYYSHEIGERKPDVSSFQYVLNDAGLIPEECLFVDDLAENTKVAASLGIHTLTHDPKEDIAEVLPEFLSRNQQTGI